jgi:hypothetical protein
MTATETSSIFVAKDREMDSVSLNYPIEKCWGPNPSAQHGTSHTPPTHTFRIQNTVYARDMSLKGAYSRLHNVVSERGLFGTLPQPTIVLSPHTPWRSLA